MAYTQQTPIGTPDFNLITKTLASLQPDSALQQYAQLHKNNPYILSLAKSESDRRKALRTAAQGNPGQQPTVADQSIAGMAPAPVMTGSGGTLQTGYGGPVTTGMASGGLPEDYGIAQLPAPNMQAMADGGIAGYGDGDDVPKRNGMAQGGMYDFAQRSEPVVRMSGGGAVQKFAGKGEQLVRTTDGGKTWFLDIPETIRDPSVPYYRLIPNPAAKLADMKFPSKAAALEAATTASTKYSAAPGAKPYSLDLGSALPTVDNRYVTTEGKGFVRNAELTDKEHNDEKKQGLRQNQIPTFAGPDAPIVPRFQPGVSDAPAPAAPVPDAPAAVAPAAPAASNAPAAPAAPSTQGTQGGTSGMGIKGMYDLFAGPKNVRDTELNEIQQRIREQGESETSAAQRQLDRLKSDITAQGEYGKDKETKLKAKEERIGKEEGKAGGLALLEAGLAMMAGGSANAFANIGQGAMVGTAAYRKSLDKIEDAKDKLDDAYGRLEDVRFNQKNLNNAEIRRATADVDKAANAGLKSLTDFAVTRYGMSREDAKTMFTGAVQTNVANIGASATRYSADRRSADNKDYINAVRGADSVEKARKNLMEQIQKSNKYATQDEVTAEFNKQWPEMLRLNPNLAQLVGSTGGGAATSAAPDFVYKDGKIQPAKS